MSEVKMRNAVGSGAGMNWTSRTVLTVSPEDRFPECLVYAIEREFPLIAVEQVSSLEAACTKFERPVCLLLVDTEFLDKIGDYTANLMRLHPSAPVVLAQRDSRTPVSVQNVFDSKIVRGVLPMDLRLDLWLSIVRLMLRGGEYFPLAMFQSYAMGCSEKAQETGQAPHAAGSDVSFDEMGELTEREFQILEMVARGLQNKIIAAALGLSEHTVKIHLHNIITKLGAHNRTEAAAVFHNRKGTINSSMERAKPPQISES